ncbi:MAG: YceI family protein [Flammeovirgaceae bacterium]|nr:YceI family protein [Flammeovirgaceae bacterium]
MRLLFIVLTAFSLITPETHLEQGTLIHDCTIQFSIRNASIEVNGFISGVNAEIKFDPGNLNGSLIQATADPSTIQTGISVRDKHLKRSDFFDVKNYPTVTIRSKRFQKKGKNKFSGQFELTIKNVTRTITIPIVLSREDNIIVYKGEFEMNRLDFKLGEESLILDNIVHVTLKARSLK